LSWTCDDLSVTDLVLLLTFGFGLGRLLGLRGSRASGGAFIARCRPSPGCYGVSPCACLGDAVLLDESSISRGPDDLVGGDGHSIELTEACD